MMCSEECPRQRKHSVLPVLKSTLQRPLFLLCTLLAISLSSKLLFCSADLLESYIYAPAPLYFNFQLLFHPLKPQFLLTWLPLFAVHALAGLPASHPRPPLLSEPLLSPGFHRFFQGAFPVFFRGAPLASIPSLTLLPTSSHSPHAPWVIPFTGMASGLTMMTQ